MEDFFAGIEFIKWKGDSGLSVARVFEEKHGYGVLMRKDNFPWKVRNCLPKVIEFVSDEISANVSRFLKTYKVSGYYEYGYNKLRGNAK